MAVETYKVLGQANPGATTLVDAYTVPALTSSVISTVMVCNRSATPTTFRIAIAPAGAGDDLKHYIAYDADLEANEVWSFTIGVTLAASDVIRVYAVLATVSFSIFGAEVS